MAYSSSKSHTDLKLEPIVEEETMRISFILNIDGANVRTSHRESAYPVWIACADLPSKVRFFLLLLVYMPYGMGLNLVIGVSYLTT